MIEYPRGTRIGEGQRGSALIGSLRISYLFDRDLLGIPVALLLYSQKCQGVPFSPFVKS